VDAPTNCQPTLPCVSELSVASITTGQTLVMSDASVIVRRTSPGVRR